MFLRNADHEDEIAEDREQEVQVFEQAYTIPPAADIPITTINKVMFSSHMPMHASMRQGT